MDPIRTQAYAKLVENGVNAIEEINRLKDGGYTKEEIYVISYDQDREDRIAEAADANEVGRQEEGLLGIVADLFRSRGSELRAKIASLGFSDSEAEFYEKELNQGKVLLVAKKAARS
ncbi:general stress protein [Paenibacillus spiritus]|uniref:General stress protein n=1 Tax=Paenibacillus spiritus TaxID=2496557 RepID=A0A5J5G5F3_9BACL|nr:MULTISPECIES: general stress protein [Paenibacillus]KAA9002104.1 general stress protein [Paenibacillus spiritus]